MIIIKLGGIALVCVVHAMILDIPIKDQKAIKETLKISLQRQNKLKLDPEMQAEQEDFNRKLKKSKKELDYKYEGWVTLDTILEDKDE